MILNDIEGAVHLVHEYGERFEGWYFSKTFIYKKEITLNYKNNQIIYTFDHYDYNYRFIMPSKIEFVGDMISYSNGERELGVFRFPRDKGGKFVAPISLDKKKMTELMDLSKEDKDKLLSMQAPLVFEAFRISQYGFELFDLTDDTIEDISKLTDSEFVLYVKEYQSLIIREKTDEIKEKINSIPNYLLILKNTLNRQWKNINDAVLATDEIIHI